MAVDPRDQVYGIVAHPTMDPDAKAKAIDMLYGVGAPPPAAGPDLRTAEGGPAAPTLGDAMSAFGGNAPPATVQALEGPPPGAQQPQASATDVGGANMGALFGGGEYKAPPVPSPPPPAEHGAEHGGHGEAPGHGAGGHGGAAEGHGEAPSSAPADVDEGKVAGAQIRSLFDEMTGSVPGHRVAAHDQLAGAVTEKAAPIPDSVKQALGDDAKKEAALAIAQGDEASKAHLDAAIGFDNQAHQAHADRAALVEKNRANEAELKDKDQHFEQLVKDTAVKPGDWWSSKDTGHKILALISAAMFGLAGDPKGLQDLIDADLADKRLNREKLLGARKSAIDGFRNRMMSPEAADAAERALANQAVAAEAMRLGEAAKAPEARAAAERIAQEHLTQFDRHTEDWARLEGGTIRQNIANVPEHYTGGPKMSRVDAYAKLTKLGYTAEQIASALGPSGSIGGGESPDEGKRRVTFNAGEQVGYVANEGQQKEMQTLATAISGLKATYARIRELSKSSGHTIAGPEKAALQADIADGMQQLQAMAGGEGANKKVAGEMLQMLKPLTGAVALETGTMDANAIAQLNEAYRIVDNKEEAIKGVLTPSPKTRPHGGKIQTLGKSKQSLDFEKE